MALDSATKRRSMLAMGVLALILHPVPDGIIAAIDQKHFLGLMAAVATQTGLATSNIHIFSTSVVEPGHVSDSGDNVLIKGDIEAQGDAFVDETITALALIVDTDTLVVDAVNHRVELNAAANPELRISQGGSTTNYASFIDNSTTQFLIAKITNSGDALIDINPKPTDGTSKATFRFFRETNTSGLVGFNIFRGDGTGSNIHQINANGTTVFNNLLDDLDFIIKGTNEANLFRVDAGNDRIGIGTGTPNTTLQVVGTAGFGDDAGNETQFSATGVQTMAGTARVMISVDLEPSVATRPSANPPGEGTEDSFATHDFNATTDESVFFHWEIPHDYVDAGTIHIHFDFFVDTAEAGATSIVWGVEYKKQSIGDNFDFSSGTTTGYTQISVTSGTPTNDKKTHQSGEVALTTTGFSAGDYVLLRLFRDANGTGGADDFPRDARVLDYHIEYLSDKLGEAT